MEVINNMLKSVINSSIEDIFISVYSIYQPVALASVPIIAEALQYPCYVYDVKVSFDY